MTASGGTRVCDASAMLALTAPAPLGVAIGWAPFVAPRTIPRPGRAPGSASRLEEDYLRTTRKARAVFERLFYGH